jgi:hypothetical protein
LLNLEKHFRQEAHFTGGIPIDKKVKVINTLELAFVLDAPLLQMLLQLYSFKDGDNCIEMSYSEISKALSISESKAKRNIKSLLQTSYKDTPLLEALIDVFGN